MFKIICENPRLYPRYMTELAAGADVCAADDVLIPAGKVVMVPTGCYVDVEYSRKFHNFSGSYHVLDLRLRSSLCKRGLMLANGVGTIDADYDKEIKVALYNTGGYAVTLRQGERVAQLLCHPIYRLIGDVAHEEAVRVDGFGSTGV